MFLGESVPFHCCYRISDDREWLVSGMTDAAGEMVETTIVSIRTESNCDANTWMKKAIKEMWNVWMNLLTTLCGVVDKKSWAVIISKIGTITRSEHQIWKEICEMESLPVITDTLLLSVEHNPYLQITSNASAYQNFGVVLPHTTHINPCGTDSVPHQASVWVVSHVSTLAKNAKSDGLQNYRGRSESDYCDNFVGVKIGSAHPPGHPPASYMCPTIYTVLIFFSFKR
jgi:hypothetical protein